VAKFISTPITDPMGHTLVKAYVHIVFSTRKRQPLILPEIEMALHQQIASICRSLECLPLKVGGFKDHVHILCSLHKDISILELIEEVKITSSRWMRNKNDLFKNFYWQQGYGTFSLSESEIPVLSHYIENQRDHHSRMSFEDEFKRLLVENEIEYDEHVLWK
jgi:putative transposase